MKHFRCGDVIPGCTRTFTGTENEILGQVAEHARHDHGISEVSAEVVNQVRTAMVPA